MKAHLVAFFFVTMALSAGILSAQNAQDALQESRRTGLCLYIGADQPQFALDLASSGSMVLHALNLWCRSDHRRSQMGATGHN
jgi:hypothetical protein